MKSCSKTARRASLRRAILFTTTVLFLLIPAFAQETTIRSRSNLVLIPTLVKDAQAIVRFVAKEVDGIGDRIEDGGAVVAGLEIRQIGIDESLVAGEVASQFDATVEFDDRHSRRSRREERAEHGPEALHAGEFVRGAASFLNDQNERNRLAFGRFVEA